jgi:type IV secretory pathway VirB4 component
MSKSVQEFIPIKEIHDNVVVLKSGELRQVLMASSVNFDLKSFDEQQALLLQYQNFLNSLDFPVQIFVQSRKLDIRPYIGTLEARVKDQVNDLLKIQTREYIQFIKNVTEQTNVMSKTFYIAISYAPAYFQGKGGFLSRLRKPKEGSKRKLENFEENRSQLEQRRSVVQQGLSRVGIRTVVLGTEELVELYYKIFNPGELEIPVVQEA